MKNLLYLLFSLFFSLIISGCSQCFVNTTAMSTLALECPNVSCKDYPNIDPYLEGHNEFLGSDSQMIYWAHKTKDSLYTRYDKLCKNILETFKQDKEFVQAFKKDMAAFEVYRNTQKELEFPKDKDYGTMREYAEWSSDYKLTVIHIEQLKQKISAYCDCNSSFLQNKDICSKENIDKMFDSIKLKEPKPFISTPYDKQ